MDGSGKSTLSKELYHNLEKLGYKVTYNWWLEGENSIIRRFLRVTTRNPLIKDQKVKKSKNEILKRNTIVNFFYPKIVIYDYLISGFFKIRFSSLFQKNKIKIFDRFYYDTLFALAEEFDIPDLVVKKYLLKFQRYLKDPDVLFFIDVPPEVAYSRKKEELLSQENALKMWKDYQKLFDIIKKFPKKGIYKIDNSQNISSVNIDTLNYTLERIGIITNE